MSVVPDPHHLRDRRVSTGEPLGAPAARRRQAPLSETAAATVAAGREVITRVLAGEDDRLVAVVGPCSVHDPRAALDYARRLAPLAARLDDALVVVIRVYFEKPRTTLGWKGLVNDPFLDGSCQVGVGLGLARRVLVDVVELGLPVACEFLDPILPQYLADVVSWGAIGARTVESQIHRQLASGLSMPVGIKNATNGDVGVAVAAVQAAMAPHALTGIDDDGHAAVFQTTGNPDAHVILRGGTAGPNYGAEAVGDALDRLATAGLAPRVVVDASHGNSGGDHTRQSVVAADVAGQVAAGNTGIVGVMVESFLVEGRQQLEPGHADRLVYGQSITDGCLGWDATEAVADRLAEAVRRRRQAGAATVARPAALSETR